MDVRPAGAGPAGTDLARGTGQVASVAASGAPARSGATPAAGAIDVAAFPELSASDIASLIRILEPLPATSVQAADFVHSAVSAAAEGDTARVLTALTDAVRVNPVQIETLRSQPGLEPMRAQVDQFLNRLTAVVKLDAEGRLTRATQVLEALGAQKLPEWDASPETLLTTARRLLDAGGHANYVRTAELAQVLIDGAARGLPAITNTPVPNMPADIRLEAGPRTVPQRGWIGLLKQARPQFRVLWRRAPLLILLLGWLGIGLIFGIFSLAARNLVLTVSVIDGGFEVWGLGFLFLVILGFYSRIRKVRLR